MKQQEIKNKQPQKETGAAHIYIELSDGIITVLHGTDKSVLLVTDTKPGDWGKLWKTLRTMGSNPKTLKNSQ